MTITPEELARVGSVLYGPLWQRELARHLDVTDRTMRRWASGVSRIPHLAGELMQLLKDNNKKLIAVYRMLEQVQTREAKEDEAKEDEAKKDKDCA